VNENHRRLCPSEEWAAHLRGEILETLEGLKAGAALPRRLSRARLGAARLGIYLGVVALAGATFLALRARPTPSRKLTDSHAEAAAPVPQSERPGLGVDASVRGGFLRVTNGPESLTGVRLLLHSEGGAVHTFDLPEGLGPGESCDVAIEDFRPKPEDGAVFSSIVLEAFGSGDGRREAHVALRSGASAAVSGKE